MPGTLIILPTFNEAEYLQPMAERLLALEPALEVLVVDDNSPDGTGEIADGLAKVNDRFHVLHRTPTGLLPLGKAPRVAVGFNIF